MKNMIIASTSTIYGSAYLSYLIKEIDELYSGVEEVVFIPFARPSGISHDAYTDLVQQAFSDLGICVKGLHEFDNYKQAIEQAQGIFTGGGNTFLLVKTLHEHDLMGVLRTSVEKGTPYLGTSAGSNICGLDMRTTNDMPIVRPDSFECTGLISFNINAHYLDVDPKSKHKGETRETRIKEFHCFNDQVVLGLREGSFLRVFNNQIQLQGGLSARVFKKDQEAYELNNGSEISF